MFRKLLATTLLLLGAWGVATAQPSGLAPENPARRQVAALIDESAALSLPVRVERAFMLTLQAAHDALQQGQVPKALVHLKTFAVEVRGAKRAKRLPAEAADLLIARAEEAMNMCHRRTASRLNGQ